MFIDLKELNIFMNFQKIKQKTSMLDLIGKLKLFQTLDMIIN